MDESDIKLIEELVKRVGPVVVSHVALAFFIAFLMIDVLRIIVRRVHDRFTPDDVDD